MSTTKRGPGVTSVEANKLLYEMEQKFDLIRLKARRADLEREEEHLAEEEELLKDDLKPQNNRTVQLSETPTQAAGVRGLWRALAKMKSILWLEVRREVLAGEVRRLSLLEDEIEFALRLRKPRPPR